MADEGRLAGVEGLAGQIASLALVDQHAHPVLGHDVTQPGFERLITELIPRGACYPHSPHRPPPPGEAPPAAVVRPPPEHCPEACLEFTRRMLLGKESPFTEHRVVSPTSPPFCLNRCRPALATSSRALATCAAFATCATSSASCSSTRRSRPTWDVLGRTWACEHEQVVPDMVLVSKGLASGLQVSAVIANDENAESWGPDAHVGTLRRARSPAPPRTPPSRFTGRTTKKPTPDEAAWMLDFCVREGLLFEKGGYYCNRFHLIPSLVMETELIDRAVDVLDSATAMTEARSGATAD